MEGEYRPKSEEEKDDDLKSHLKSKDRKEVNGIVLGFERTHAFDPKAPWTLRHLRLVNTTNKTCRPWVLLTHVLRKVLSIVDR